MADRGLVEVGSLTWRPYGRAEPVLDEVSFTIPAGRRVLLAGVSGSGKSTLLRALAGVLETTGAGQRSGTVHLDGVDPAQRPGAVGLVLQEPGSGVVAASLDRDVAFGPENLCLPGDRIAELVPAELAAVDLTMDAGSSPLDLSGGELQRLSLAGSLATRPGLLLLDEPTAMLDERTAESVRGWVERVVVERGLTVVVAEHRLAGWLDFADDLLVLDRRGRVAGYGPVTRVLAELGPQLLQEGIWLPGAADPEPLDLTEVLSAGGRIRPASGEPVMAAIGVEVVRRTRVLHGTERVSRALTGADLTARAGTTTALVGPSGSGKSTLLGVLAGLVPPTAGTVRAAPECAPEPGRLEPAGWSSTELAAALAWLPQDATRGFTARTVLDEVLATGMALHRLDPAMRDRAVRLLAALGLGERLATDPRRLSGGEQRRLALAAAVLHDPALLLADEPTVGQDRHTWAAVMGVIEATRRRGAGVVVSTHDAALVGAADEVHRLAPSPEPPPPASRRVLVERTGPFAALVALLALLPLPALVHTVPQALAVLAVEAAWAVVALTAVGPGRRPVGRARRVGARLVAPAVGALGVAWSAWLLGGHDLTAATVAGLRVAGLVAPGAVVLPYLDPDTLGDQLHQWLRLPARPVVVAVAVLGRFQSLTVLWQELTAVRRVRGLSGGRGSAARLREAGVRTIALLATALSGASAMAVAMDARGFAGATRRTALRRARWRPADTVALAAAGSVIVVAALLR